MDFNRFEPVRIGVIGLGNFGRLHARTLAGLAEANLVAVVARRQESLDMLSKELGIIQGMAPVPGSQQFLKFRPVRIAPDGVMICDDPSAIADPV